jgi:hypothetical protein
MLPMPWQLPSVIFIPIVCVRLLKANLDSTS